MGMGRGVSIAWPRQAMVAGVLFFSGDPTRVAGVVFFSGDTTRVAGVLFFSGDPTRVAGVLFFSGDPTRVAGVLFFSGDPHGWLVSYSSLETPHGDKQSVKVRWLQDAANSEIQKVR